MPRRAALGSPPPDPHGHTRTCKVNRNRDVEIIRFPSDKTLVLHDRPVAGSTSAGVPGSPGAGEGTSLRQRPSCPSCWLMTRTGTPWRTRCPHPCKEPPSPAATGDSSARDAAGHSTHVPRHLVFTSQSTGLYTERLHGPNQMASTTQHAAPLTSHQHGLPTRLAPLTHSRGVLVGKRERQDPALKAPWDPLPVHVPFSCPGSDLMLQPKQLGDVPPRSGQRPLGLPLALLRNGGTEPDWGGDGDRSQGHTGGGKGSVE